MVAPFSINLWLGTDSHKYLAACDLMMLNGDTKNISDVELLPIKNIFESWTGNLQ